MAEIIYPAAFNTPGSGNPDAFPLDATAVGTPGDTVAVNEELTELRAAAIETQRHLAGVEGETRHLERLGSAMEAEAATMEDLGLDLGRQMDRLIAETQRMAAYLRSSC